MTASLRDKTIIMTAAGRGTDREIALREARNGANIVVASKTSSPNPKLEARSTLSRGLSRARAVDVFGGIDCLVNNARTINLTRIPNLPMKRLDLKHQVNLRGTDAMTQACYPHLAKAENPHVLVFSQPQKGLFML